MHLTQEQQQNIDGVGRKYCLKFILIHGSYATGKMKTGSDLAEIFGDNPRRELDIKSLHKADPLFCYQVAKDSQLIYGDPTDFNEFKAHAFSNYFDSKDLFHLEEILIQKFQNYLNQKYAR